MRVAAAVPGRRQKAPRRRTGAERGEDEGVTQALAAAEGEMLQCRAREKVVAQAMAGYPVSG